MNNSAILFLNSINDKYNEKTAIIDNDYEISYKQYKELSMNIGTYILNNFHEFKKNRPIAVFLPKGYHCIISFMGILYSGNIYIPLDTTMPLNRTEKIILNLKPEIIITSEVELKKLTGLKFEKDKIILIEDIIKSKFDIEKINFAIKQIIDTDPIYIMYTSGSTGEPKGVVIPHKGVIDFIFWLENTFNFNDNMILGSQSPFYFDNTVLDIYLTLKVSGTIVLIPDVLFQMPTKILNYLNDTKINFIFWVPTVLINLANSGELFNIKLNYLEKIFFAGEVMPNKQLNMWRNVLSNAMFVNLYGPTEITDICVYYILDRLFKDYDPLPIGYPCKNMNFLILDENEKESKKGDIGELCILGSGLALGYYNDKNKSNKVFVQNPLNNNYFEIIYKTGDLVYLSEDNLIMYSGRKDSQIKHRGNRIELGEIEICAKSLTYVNNACVIYDDIEQQIILFLEMNNLIDKKVIRKELLKLLPKYMIPQVINIMEKFPYTPNAKIDRVGLKKLMININSN